MRVRLALLSVLAALASSAVAAVGTPFEYLSYGPLFALGQAAAALLAGLRPHPLGAIAGWGIVAVAWFVTPFFVLVFSEPTLQLPIIGWAVGAAFAATFLATGLALVSLDLSAVALPVMIAAAIGWGLIAGNAETVADVRHAIGFQVPMGLCGAFWLTMPPRRSGILHRMLDEIFD